MNIFQRLFSKAQQSFSFVPEWVKYNFMPISFDRLYRDGYKQNSAVSACITALAFSFPEPPLLPGTETEGKFVADYKHPALSLLRKPNDDMGEAELMQFAVTVASIGGSLYLWKERLQNGRIRALWPFSDAQMQPVPGRDTSEGFVLRYDYDPGTGQKIPIPKEDVIHWKWMPDPKQPWRGIGAIELCAREVDKDNEAGAYIYALLKNNAVPPVVITLAEGSEADGKTIRRLRKEWNQKYGGENRGGVAFLTAGMKAEKLGWNMQELAAEALNAVPESRIAANFRVPPVVAGLSVGLKRSDYGDQAARRAFAEQTLTALWRMLASEITNGLKDEFPATGKGQAQGLPQLQFQFDLSKVLALRDDENKIWERATLAFDRSGITRAEMKRMVGIEPGPGDDVYKVSLANEFIPADQLSVGGGGRLSDGSGKSSTTKNTKGHKGNQKNRAIGRQLQRVRADVGRRMGQAVDVYFSKLADRAVGRTSGKQLSVDGGQLTPQAAKQPSPQMLTHLGGVDLKELDAGDLITDGDQEELTNLLKRYYLEIMQLSWNLWDMSLGVELAFDLEDPTVVKVLRMAEVNAETVNEYTMEEVGKLLADGYERGWGIDQIVRGDPENGIPGLRDVIDETYQGRARAIARTELGEAQNAASAGRYGRAGVDLVEILDNGATDDDEPCIEANGQIWTLEYFTDHLLEHTNCTRCGVPYFGDEEPDQG